MANPSLTLTAGSLDVELSPSIGGAISNFTCTDGGGKTPILRSCHTPLENVLDAACFPLVPFSNRIRGGCFRFRDRQVSLRPNMAGDPSPLHGQGWTSAWTIETVSEAEAALVFEHQAGDWPWSYRATEHFSLSDNSLHLRLECRNTSGEPMPCGLGFHPYFHCDADTRIQTSVAHVCTVDEDVLPVARMPAEGRYAIADAPVCGRSLDNGYDGWDGEAIFTDPVWPFELRLSSPQARYFQLYSPPQGGIFVAEPVTHANAALNEPETDWTSLGMRVLEPGEAMELEARLEVQPKS